MGQLTYSFAGVNKRQLEASIDNLRNSPTFRQLEADTSQRYDRAVIVMGPDINPTDRTGHRYPAVSGGGAGDPRKLYIFLDTKTSATRPTPLGDEALTVDQLIAHEMAHATFPPQPFSAHDLGGAPSKQQEEEERAAVQLSNQVSADLGMRGIQGPPAYRNNPGPLSTFRDPYAADPSILKFGDGTRADVGDGPLEGAPTVGAAIYGIKRLWAPDGTGSAQKVQAPPSAPDAVYSPMGDFYGSFPRAPDAANARSAALKSSQSNPASIYPEPNAPASLFSRLMSIGPDSPSAADNAAQVAAFPGQNVFANPTQDSPPLPPDLTQQTGNPPERSLGRRTYDPSQGSPFKTQTAPASASPDGPLSLDDAYLEYLRRLNAV